VSWSLVLTLGPADPASADLEVALRLAVAGLIGLAIGIEREWSGHAAGPRARFAGVRTFFMLGLIGGMAGWLAAQDRLALAVILLAGSALLATAAYVVASQQTGDRDGTTEAAALLVLATGTLSGLGYETHTGRPKRVPGPPRTVQPAAALPHSSR
jgi:uncharacterized membrane protein YhiD involved in acid resistance